MTTHLVWLRNDLRLHDNTALYAACQDPHARVLAVFIVTPQQWRDHDMSPRQAEFIRQHLCHLADDLAARGIVLHYQQCADFASQVDWLAAFCQRERVDRLFYNYQYEFNERERDRQLERRFGDETQCQGFDDSVPPPGRVHTGNQQMYKVYTPFRNAFLRRLEEQDPACLPAPAPAPRAGAPCGKTCEIATFDYPTTPPGKTIPPVKRPHSPVCVPFVINICRIITAAAIFRRWTPPAGCPPGWRSAFYRSASVISGCTRRPPKR